MELILNDIRSYQVGFHIMNIFCAILIQKKRKQFGNPMNKLEKFGTRLKELRKSRGYSQEALATKLGITRRMVSYYECESPKLPSDILPQLAEILQVSITTLFGEKEPISDGRTVDSKFWPKWEKLSSDDRKVLNKMADALINKS